MYTICFVVLSPNSSFDSYRYGCGFAGHRHSDWAPIFYDYTCYRSFYHRSFGGSLTFCVV